MKLSKDYLVEGKVLKAGTEILLENTITYNTLEELSYDLDNVYIVECRDQKTNFSYGSIEVSEVSYFGSGLGSLSFGGSTRQTGFVAYEKLVDSIMSDGFGKVTINFKTGTYFLVIIA